MSVQLIIRPQNYNGFSSSSFNLPVEMLANGNGFVNVEDYVSNYPIPYSTLSQQAVTALFPPTYFNTWYGYYTTTGYLSPVSNSAGQLYFFGNGSGILQNLTNLTAGLVYNLELTVELVGGLLYFPLTLDIFNEDVLDTSIVITPTSDVTTVQFTAPNDNFTMLALTNISSTVTDLVVVTNISVMAAPPEPSILGDGQVILDLYEEEDLPLTLSVEDFKNVAENVASYSKAFNLPATKRNNKAFDSIFEITRDYQGIIFNPYQKTECILKQDGLLLFKGYLRLLDVTDKLGEISYNVNLYSEVIALADTLKDRAFRDLVFSELEHDYNHTNIVLSGTGNLVLTNPLPAGSFAGAAGATITNVVRYPFVDWNHNYAMTSGGMAKLLTLESSFRPFISIKYLIDRIFEASDFTYESTFISNDNDFNKLYMDFNWGADNAPVVFDSSGELTNVSDVGLGTSMATLDFDEMNYPTVGGNPLSANFGYSSGVFTALEDGQVYTFNYNMEFNRFAISDTLFVQWLVNGTPVDVATSTATSFIYSGSFTTPPLSAGDTVLCQAYSTLGLYELDGVLSLTGTTPSLVTITTTSDQTTSDTLLQTLRGELGQWDFLKGLITMFNLVTLPDEDNPNNIIIEPYGEVFVNTGSGTNLASRGIQHDWTNKIDVSEMKLEPLTDLNKNTIFKFVEDDDDYSFNQYKNQVGGHLYGSKEYDSTFVFDILEGTKEIVAEPFAATVVKPLMSQFPEFITPAIYARGSDATWEGFDNSPRIMYNNGVKTLSSDTYSVPAQNGSPANALVDKFLQFSHIKNGGTSISDYSDFHFGECQLLTNQATTLNNLFNLYWLPYYLQLYNPNTRVMTIKVNLNASDINLFKFNDKVFLKNRVFRCNRIDYKPNDLSTVEFILIT